MAGLVILMLGVICTQGAAQAAADNEPGSAEEAVGALEWRFERLPASAVDPSLATHERWASPFAVISRGSLGERTARRAVIGEVDTLESDDPARSVTIVRVLRAEETEETEETETPRSQTLNIPQEESPR